MTTIQEILDFSLDNLQVLYTKHNVYETTYDSFISLIKVIPLENILNTVKTLRYEEVNEYI